MKTIQQISSEYDTDKSVHKHYLQNYAELFEPLVETEVKLLELGIFHGGSLLMWRDFFAKGQIAGLDISPVEIEDDSGRVHIYQGKQNDKNYLDKIAREIAPDGFDIIIDDCSHIGALSRISFWHLFNNHLKSGGIYVIEDWGTGYWDSWADGSGFKHYDFGRDLGFSEKAAFKLDYLQKNLLRSIPVVNSLTSRLKGVLLKNACHSHNVGMVGFIKELVDECGMGDVNHSQAGVSDGRQSHFRELKISHGHVFVVKV